MSAPKQGKSRSGSTEDCACACRVESIVSVDDRGQMVLPKDLRERTRIRPGDKLALVSWERDGEVCCLSLIKAEELTDMVKQRLGPVMADVLNT